MTELILGGGCFWCTDAVFQQLKGVGLVESGYANGSGVAEYYRITSGHTGYAEVVKVQFDDLVLPAETLLDIFFLIHNPTTLNRQGADVGSQYRSCMLYQSDEQRQLFEAACERAQAHWDGPIVTEIAPLDTYHPAEPEHQDYFAKQPASGYCSVVIAPKLIKARAAYAEWFHKEE